jgi:ubiquinone/menaquinone biosynthesis C-methylase UbiE
MFTPYAIDLSRRAHVPPNGSVLELACGTGLLTQQLRAQLPASARIVATDLNDAMIEQARLRWSESDSVVWQQADATALPFADQSFDAVVCQCGLMFFPDKVQALREMRRVLRPGGRLAFNVWGTLEENQYAHLAQAVVERFIPQNAPQFFHVPFGFSDAKLLRGWLDESGFTRIEFERLAKRARAPSAKSFADGLIQGYPVSFALKEKGIPIDAVVAALATELAALGGAEPFESDMCALISTAHRGD